MAPLRLIYGVEMTKRWRKNGRHIHHLGSQTASWSSCRSARNYFPSRTALCVHKHDTSTVGYGLPLHSPAWALSQHRGAKGKRKKIQILQFSLHALPGQCCQQAVITRKVVPDYKNKWQRKKYKWIDSMRHNWPMTRVLSQRLYLTKPRRVVKKKIVSIIYILITRYNDLGTRSHLGVYLCYTLYTCLLSTSRV